MNIGHFPLKSDKINWKINKKHINLRIISSKSPANIKITWGKWRSAEHKLLLPNSKPNVGDNTKAKSMQHNILHNM